MRLFIPNHPLSLEPPNSEAPEIDPFQQSEYRDKIRAYPCFQDQTVDFFYSPSALYPEINFKRLYLLLWPYRYYNTLPSFWVLPNGDYSELQFFRYEKTKRAHEFTQEASLSFLEKPSAVLSILVLEANPDALRSLKMYHETLFLSLSSGIEFQKQIMIGGNVEIARVVFEELKQKPHPDIGLFTQKSNSSGLLHYLWEKFPNHRSVFFSKFKLHEICKDAYYNVLSFWLRKKGEFEKEGIVVEEQSATGHPIQWALESEHPHSIWILQLLLMGQFSINSEDCLHANSPEKLQIALEHCPPIFETLIHAIHLDLTGPTSLTQKLLHKLMDANIIIHSDHLLSLRSSKSPHMAAVIRYMDTFREKCAPQLFFYACLASNDSALLGEFSNSLKKFIREHRETIVYRPFIRSIMRNNEKTALIQLQAISGQEQESEPKSLAETRPTELDAIKNVLSGGILNSYSDRIAAHIYVLQLPEYGSQALFIHRAQLFGPEKIYRALLEYRELAQDPDLTLHYFELALKYGIFENKKPLFGENLYLKSAAEIKALKANLSPPPNSNQMPTENTHPLKRQTLFETREIYEKRYPSLKPNYDADAYLEQSL